MITSVEFASVVRGICGWCGKEREEVFNVAFSDGSFVGPLCKQDLLRAIKMKCSKPVVPDPSRTANGPVEVKK